MISAHALTARIHSAADTLEASDLRPGPAVDAAFTELVSLSLGPREADASAVLSLLGARVDSIRDLCAAGETELESVWSDRICLAADPWAELALFPYLANYRDLVSLELGVLHALGVRPRSAVMLGSGPLPLTGLVMAAYHGLDVVLVDRDTDCLRRGRAVADALGITGIHHVLADAQDELPAEVSEVDLVLQAALVGAHGPAKRAVVQGLAAAMRPGTHLLVRSAAGLRELLYPPVSLVGLPEFTMLVEVHPHHEVVNSVLVARRTGYEA